VSGLWIVSCGSMALAWSSSLRDIELFGGKDGSTVFEIGRQDSVIDVRTITSDKSPGVPGPWEKYHDEPESYHTYGTTAYPANP
jgi:hypothetical protein